MIAGADGCRSGWLCLTAQDDGTCVSGFIAESFAALLQRLPHSSILAIDIPIGLPSRGPRGCELDARRRLRARASSVFPSPIRAALEATDYSAACAAREAVDGKRMSKQAFAILPKIREVDRELRQPGARCSVRECHPEVSFAVWAGAPLLHAKKRQPGRDERIAMIDAVWPGERASVSATLPRGTFAPDDLHDAFAALWTAIRIRRGVALELPGEIELDEHGIRMEIVA
jgi:predicted RNase H-like nuclease